MNANLPSESQPPQPVRKIPFGLLSLISALLIIVYILFLIYIMRSSHQSIDNPNLLFSVFSALSAMAFVTGGIDLYLTNRKIPAGAIIALITVLTFPAILVFGNLDISSAFFFSVIFSLWAFVYAIIQIILVIKTKVAILARLGIALALLSNVFAGLILIVAFMSID